TVASAPPSIAPTTAVRRPPTDPVATTAKPSAARGGAGTRPRRPVTTTSNPAQRAAARAQALSACLQLASANHDLVVAANQAWYQPLLRRLTRLHKLGSPKFRRLQLEEKQAQTEIQAQHAIDEANCYLPAEK